MAPHDSHLGTVELELPLVVDWSADDDAPIATEREMLDLLHARYGAQYGNGIRYVCAEHVRNKAGFDATRTADFIAMDVWPSSGLLVHGHEVKVTRSDWLRELADPGKADAFMRYVDRWWLVVPHQRVVRDDLPAGWGLLVRRNGRLAVARPAPPLAPEPMPRSLLAPLLRSVLLTGERRQVRAPASTQEPAP